ncbi:glycosyltransferase [Rhodoferax sp.]|uniref:glycosyltransferase family 4 protein n=1 Tax=Rhodoferax sp. TaxID=50421 RepID=UPI0025F99C6B|nr:glycosyltransferase [Rhodoferax sp.]
MHVVHVIVGMDVGGAELMLKRLVDASRIHVEQRHAIISLTTLGSVGKALAAQGVQVEALGMRSALDLPGILWNLCTRIRAFRPDAVQTWMYHADLLGGIAARFAGVRHVIWGIRATELPYDGPMSTRVVRWMCARLSRRIPKVIVCAAGASMDAHRNLGYDASKMMVIPNGYDFSLLQASDADRQQIRALGAIAEDEIIVGTVGRFHSDKDQRNFVRAAGLLGAEFPALRFVMVGRGLDGGNAQLAGWIAETGWQDRFVLLGERSDVPACLAAMDVFCLPSRSEGFPNVLIEAMAMGLPCVATDVGDVADILGAGGELVVKENSVELAAAIRRLLGRGEAGWRQLGADNCLRVRSEYGIERAHARFSEVYRRLVGQTGVS